MGCSLPWSRTWRCRGVGGIEVARRIKRDWPHLALILTTGYTADAIPVEEMPASFAFVPKPFSTDDLVRKLAALLDGAAAQERAAGLAPCFW